MRVLVVGGSGLLGQQLVSLLKQQDFEVMGTYFSEPVHDDHFFPLDVTDVLCVKDVFEKVKPDVVVLTAAFTHVDACETNKESAFSLNVTGTANVAMACESVGAKMVYMSTDYVFNGEKGGYTETDEPDPLGYYGFTKLQGEKQVQNICSDYLIARTSVLFGLHKPNFVTWMISLFKQKKPFSIVTDQIISPTNTFDLSEQLIALLENDAQGVFHTAGGEIVSRFDLALRTAEFFDFDADLVQPTVMDEMGWVAKRPQDSSLDISKIRKFKKPYSLEKSLGLLKEGVVGGN